MRRVSATELRAFLLDWLGLRGPFWLPGTEAAQAAALGMTQIDSIRSAGLRNHELAWAARAGTAPARLYDLLYGSNGFLETHHPLFAVRRDWVPALTSGFGDLGDRHRAERERFRPVMRRVERHIRRNGPVTAAQFSSERVPGGFSTVKATTKALDFLFYERRLQIAGRTAHFHRVFDLTERVAPEFLPWQPLAAADYERFLIDSALTVLKIATAEQVAARAALHFGQWRGARIARFRALADTLLPECARSVVVHDLPDSPVYWYRAEDEAGWERSAHAAPEMPARLVPPLDNLLFSRQRFAALFGLDYKFEAYTPADRRRFYFAMPILVDDAIVGLIDGRRVVEGGRVAWQIAGLDLLRPAPPEVLRAGIHRIARLAGAERVTAATRLARDVRRTLVGRCEV